MDKILKLIRNMAPEAEVEKAIQRELDASYNDGYDSGQDDCECSDCE